MAGRPSDLGMKMADLPIAEPCHEDWDAMHPAPGARRFCDHCTKHVHDLSSMTRSAAEEVLGQRAEGHKICVRYRVDVATGTIKFQPEPAACDSEPGASALVQSLAPVAPSNVVPVSALSRRTASVRPAAALAVALAACTPLDNDDFEVETPEAVEPVDAQPEVTVIPTAKQGPATAPTPVREVEMMGEPPAIEEVEMMGDVAAPDEPCDPKAKPASPPPAEIVVKGGLG